MSVIAILGSDFDATSRIPEVIDWAQEDVQTLLGSISKHIVCLFVNWYWESLSVKTSTWTPQIANHSLKLVARGGSMMASWVYTERITLHGRLAYSTSNW